MLKLLRTTTFFLKLSLAVVFGVLFGIVIAINPGNVIFNWFEYQVEMPIAVLLVMLFVFIIVFLLLYIIWKKLWGLPGYYLASVLNRKKLKSEKLVIESLTALAAHQQEEALQAAETASSLNSENPLALFMTAQMLTMSGQADRAREYFEQMAKHNSLNFLSLRGIALQLREQKDWVSLEGFLKKLLKLRPDSPWVQAQIIENQFRLVQAGQSEKILTRSLKYSLESSSWDQHQGLLYLLRAEQNKERGDLYLSLLTRAHSFDIGPGAYIDVSCKLARAYASSYVSTGGGDSKGVSYDNVFSGNITKANKILTQAFKKIPHRELIRCWLEIKPATLKPLDIYQEIEKITACFPDHPESLFVMAQAAFEAQLWGQCRKFLEKLQQEYHNSQNLCFMFAKLEEIQYPNQRDITRFWWQQAIDADPERHWVCQGCGHHSHEWQLVCQNCDTVNKSEWQGFNPKVKLVAPFPANNAANFLTMLTNN